MGVEQHVRGERFSLGDRANRFLPAQQLRLRLAFFEPQFTFPLNRYRPSCHPLSLLPERNVLAKSTEGRRKYYLVAEHLTHNRYALYTVYLIKNT